MNRSIVALLLAGAVVGLSVHAVVANEHDQLGLLNGSANIDEIKGNMGIRTDPATVSGVGYVHPVQLDVGSLGGDVVAIGTANGNGAGQYCEDDYDSGWTVYVDAVIGGVYTCVDYSHDAYGVGDNPSFQIQYKYCTAVHANRWVMTFGGVQRTCIYSGSDGGRYAGAGLETTGASTTDRNIDVKYTNMMKSLKGSSSESALDANDVVLDPAYDYDNVSATSFNTYLPPLN